MHKNTGKHDAHQGQNSQLVRGSMSSVFRVQDKEREQEEESPVNTKFNPEDSSGGYRPASHEKPAASSDTTILYS
jgi:hypothetical protein